MSTSTRFRRLVEEMEGKSKLRREAKLVFEPSDLEGLDDEDFKEKLKGMSFGVEFGTEEEPGAGGEMPVDVSGTGVGAPAAPMAAPPPSPSEGYDDLDEDYMDESDYDEMEESDGPGYVSDEFDDEGSINARTSLLTRDATHTNAKTASHYLTVKDSNQHNMDIQLTSIHKPRRRKGVSKDDWSNDFAAVSILCQSGCNIIHCMMLIF